MSFHDSSGYGKPQTRTQFARAPRLPEPVENPGEILFRNAWPRVRNTKSDPLGTAQLDAKRNLAVLRREQVLKKHFQALFHIVGEAGCSYYAAYGPRTREMWSRFVNFLHAPENLKKLDSGKVVNAAILTFESLSTWLKSEASPAAVMQDGINSESATGR